MRNGKSQGQKSHSKSQNCQAKILHKKDTHVYNNCYELHLRAINQSENAAWNKKPLARKQIFVHTLFSHSTLKLD